MTPRPYRPWTDAERQQLRRLMVEGLTYRLIAEADQQAAIEPATLEALLDRLEAQHEHLQAIADMVGESSDPGAAWESVNAIREERDALARDLEAEQNHRRAIENSEQALAAHVERLSGIHKHPFWGTADHWDQEERAFNESPTTSLARLIADKQAEGMEILVPKVADGIGRSLNLSEDDIITLEEWIGDLAEMHRDAKGEPA